MTAWLHDNWFSLLQSVGIGGSLLFTAFALRKDLQAKRVSEYLTLASQHRRLWSNLHRRPGLAHVLKPARDLAGQPVTNEEWQFLELVFVHFHTGWLLAREGSLTPMPVLAADAGEFFQLPAPAHVWEKVKTAKEPDFVRFIDDAVRMNAAKTEFQPGTTRKNQPTPG